MTDLNGIVAIISCVLGATWFLSAKLATIQTQISELQAKDATHASKESYETVAKAVQALHSRLKRLEEHIHNPQVH